MNIKGTKSEANILAAFSGESQARNRYTYYAECARAEGNLDIAELFQKMADNEREHAKIWFKLLNEGLGDSAKNLETAAMGENYEWKKMYPKFAAEAREEGLERLAVMFERIAAIENDHERRFLETYLQFRSKQMEAHTAAQKKEVEDKLAAAVNDQLERLYRCVFCGYTSEDPMDVCPVCEAIGAFQKD